MLPCISEGLLATLPGLTGLTLSPRRQVLQRPELGHCCILSKPRASQYPQVYFALSHWLAVVLSLGLTDSKDNG